MFKLIKSISIAVRPKTLATSISPVLVGFALSVKYDKYSIPIFLYTLFSAIFIQIGTNFANDLYDYIKGADDKGRLGPIRAVQSQLISVQMMKRFIFFAFVVAILCGIPLVMEGGYPILIIGILSIISGYAYTAGPYPLGYNGWGDFFVFCFFGPIAVCGTYFLQTLSISLESIIAGIILGCLSVTLLCVNNIRDVETDRKVGKRTLAVRISPKFVRVMFIILFLLSYFFSIYLSYYLSIKIFPFLLIATLPFFFKLSHDILKLRGENLNKLLERVAGYIAIYSITLMLSILI